MLRVTRQQVERFEEHRRKRSFSHSAVAVSDGLAVTDELVWYHAADPPRAYQCKIISASSVAIESAVLVELPNRRRLVLPAWTLGKSDPERGKLRYHPDQEYVGGLDARELSRQVDQCLRRLRESLDPTGALTIEERLRAVLESAVRSGWTTAMSYRFIPPLVAERDKDIEN